MTKLFKHTALVLLICTKFSCEQMIIKQEILKKHVFKNSPKFWFNYVRKIVYKDVENLAYSSNNYNFKLLQYNIQRTFLFMKRSILWYVYPTYECRTILPWKVKIPSGNLKTTEHEPLGSHQNYKWKFRLDFNLRLNVT